MYAKSSTYMNGIYFFTNKLKCPATNANMYIIPYIISFTLEIFTVLFRKKKINDIIFNRLLMETKIKIDDIL